jgi:hypothetical protein
MSIKLSNDFVSTSIPGSYIQTKVKSTPVGASNRGIVAIIGEAEGGLDFNNEDLKNNYFSPDQGAKVAAKYLSGPIVDAFNALSSASNDNDIQGSVSKVYILKSNSGAKASSLVDTNYGTLSDLNYGKAGNKISWKTLSSAAESAASVTSDDLTVSLATPTVFDGLSFGVRLNGAAVTTVTLSNTVANHDTIAELAAEISAALPAGMSCEVGTGNTLIIKINADSAAYRKAWGKSFELIDSTPGDLAVAGLDAGLVVSSQEPEVEVNVLRTDIGLNETFVAKAEVAFSMGYVGTTATMTINSTSLTTTVTGGSGANLSLTLSDYSTIQALVDYINSQTGYHAEVSGINVQANPSILDKVSAIGICSTASSLAPGRVKKGLNSYKNILATSKAVSFTATATGGLPAPTSSYTFLTGGTKGYSTSANITSALSKLEGIDTNFVIPLFSRNASLDSADNLTDSSSTYTIDAIHAAVKTHCLKMSQIKLKKNRIALLSYKGLFKDAKTKSGAIASSRGTLSFQDVKVGSSTYQPWYASCLAAGMQAAGFYKGIVKRFVNASSYVDPSDFDSGSPGDVESALEAGMLILETTNSGVRWVSDQTTYGFDSNFVYNSLQAMYLSDVLSLDFAQSIGDAFVGKSLADIDAGVVLSWITAKMDVYKKSKMVAASDDAPLGFKNVKIEISGPTMTVSLEIKLATSLYFIPITMEISEVQSSASL